MAETFNRNRFEPGQRVRRIHGSDQPRMTSGVVYTVAAFRGQEIQVEGYPDRWWNISAFQREDDGWDGQTKPKPPEWPA